MKKTNKQVVIFLLEDHNHNAWFIHFSVKYSFKKLDKTAVLSKLSEDGKESKQKPDDSSLKKEKKIRHMD